MCTKATCRPEPLHIRRFTEDKLPIRCKRLKPIDLFDDFRISYARHALDAPLKQTGKARRIKAQDSGIGTLKIWNGVNIEGGGVALVPANNHVLAILAEIDQFIGVAQIGN